MITNLIIIAAIAIVFYFYYTKQYNQPQQKATNGKKEIIKTLVRQAARWSVAASQDGNSMIAVLHSNYSLGYLYALRDIATDQEIVEATNINVLKFRDELIKIQDATTKKMAALCPKFAPQSSYLTKLSGEG